MAKKKKEKMDGELITSTVLFLLSVALLAWGIISAVHLISKGNVSLLETIGLTLLIPSLIMFFVSIYFNCSYRELEDHPGAWSTIMLILTIIPVGLVFIFKILKEAFQDAPSPKTVQAKDKDGKEHKLTQTYIGSDSYQDENGNRWKTKDDGKTFRRD